ncbi:MAG: sensor histidine kinase [Candidatus Lambdaproteobacteria bacterium]|nr:sensor histidine kinase [Candidatus Lambdaproteobacteria bacterium]
MNTMWVAWHSLKTRFTILILVGFVLTGAGAYFSFQWMLDQIVEDLGTLFAEKQVLYDRERSLRPILREVTLAKKLATSPAILAWARNEDNPALKGRGLLELENFRKAFADRSYFFAVRTSGHYYFNDAQGRYAGQELRYTLRESNPENRWFFETMNQSEPCLLNVDHDVEIGVTKLWINCVVRDGGRPVGIVGSGIELTQFIRDVIEVTRGDVINVFIDQSGAIQAHRNPKLIDFRSISKKVEERKKIFQLLDTEPQRAQLARAIAELRSGGDPVRTLYLDIGGRRYLAGLAYIREFGWYNVTLMGIGSRVTKAYFTPIAVLFVLALVAFLAISGLVFKVLILDRLSRLDQSVRQVAAGRYDLRTEETRSDEIGRLTAEFQRMAETVRDTTQHLEETVRRRTAELEGANVTKDQFFSIIAHDLRGSIGTLRNVIRDWHAGDVPDAPLLDATRASAEHAYDLLENLLQWASSQMGHRVPDPVRFAIHPELVQTLAALRAQAARKAVAIVTDVPEHLELVGDVEMVRTILRNLVSNAIKFSPQHTEIRISARGENARVAISVQDQGVGMTPEFVARLFKIGRANPSTPGTLRERGTGLGLILCKEMAVKNGGDIRVESAPGKGSTFVLMLPTSPAAAP